MRTMSSSSTFKLMVLLAITGRCWKSQGFQGKMMEEGDAFFQVRWNEGDFLNWEQDAALESSADSEDHWLSLKTHESEFYKCAIPKIHSDGRQKNVDYSGPSPLAILNELFEKKTCSYRIESFWTYELCHGNFLRQFHESKDTGKRTNLQEYYLGRYSSSLQKDVPIASGKSPKIPAKKVGDEILPYFEVVMSDGTPCDLNSGTPRRSIVLYVCSQGSRNEIEHLEETSTCEYTIIVRTSILCSHPYYLLDEPPVHSIQCYGRAGVKPRKLELQERARAAEWEALLSGAAVGEPEGKSAPQRSSEEPEPATQETASKTEETTPVTMTSQLKSQSSIGQITDRQWIHGFFTGDHCVTGGTGYWKHELCYHKYARQFHRERDGTRITITLGQWDEEEHRKWARNHPNKAKRALSVSNLYSKGDHCDETSRPRRVEVKLKCKADGDPHSVSIHLLEPEICEYIMGVESPLFCNVVDKASVDGLLPSDIL